MRWVRGTVLGAVAMTAVWWPIDAWAQTAPRDTSSDVPPSGSSIDVGEPRMEGGLATFVTKFPLEPPEGCVMWDYVIDHQPRKVGPGGQISHVSYPWESNALTMRGLMKDLPWTTVVTGVGRCNRTGKSSSGWEDIAFETKVTFTGNSNDQPGPPPSSTTTAPPASTTPRPTTTSTTITTRSPGSTGPIPGDDVELGSLLSVDTVDCDEGPFPASAREVLVQADPEAGLVREPFTFTVGRYSTSATVPPGGWSSYPAVLVFSDGVRHEVPLGMESFHVCRSGEGRLAVFPGLRVTRRFLKAGTYSAHFEQGPSRSEPVKVVVWDLDDEDDNEAYLAYKQRLARLGVVSLTASNRPSKSGDLPVALALSGAAAGVLLVDLARRGGFWADVLRKNPGYGGMTLGEYVAVQEQQRHTMDGQVQWLKLAQEVAWFTAAVAAAAALGIGIAALLNVGGAGAGITGGAGGAGLRYLDGARRVLKNVS